MIVFPPAKINLGLNVLHKRKDGYHELESVMVKTSLTDILEVLPSENFEFTQTGLTIPGENKDNLCIKAFQLLKEEFDIPNTYIHLRKIIPMGAGLGGGSADGAFVLTALNELYDLKITQKKLEEIASKLGSDCPFFISSKPQLAKGRGEVLSEINLNLKGYYVKLLNIGIHIGTKEAYDGINFSTKPNNLSELIQIPISTWKEFIKNDFETSIFITYPILSDIKNSFYKEEALYAAMSGSGSTIFGIYKNKPTSSLSKFPDAFEYIGEME